ncbi:hypothetical protein LPH44_11810 [Xylella taiwanensis]|uniref:hypothetical protein n=1 Tax=Xylella taiwanensis TaxID=1444770 RepID=UPI0013622FAA|nr:hypothetical protein [Xylella taiwanensis]MCD8467953.1 hypothetical protein [Xylella taiwanensis]UFN11327.1 hypothetical protein LPH44_11810 [Xylella taiwanensis]
MLLNNVIYTPPHRYVHAFNALGKTQHWHRVFIPEPQLQWIDIKTYSIYRLLACGARHYIIPKKSVDLSKNIIKNQKDGNNLLYPSPVVLFHASRLGRVFCIHAMQDAFGATR